MKLIQKKERQEKEMAKLTEPKSRWFRQRRGLGKWREASKRMQRSLLYEIKATET